MTTIPPTYGYAGGNAFQPGGSALQFPGHALGPTAQRLQNLLKRFKYKPGWEFTLDTPSSTIRVMTWQEPRNLLITTQVQDTYHPANSKQQIGLFCGVPEVPAITDGQIMEWLKACIAYLEMHELEEWFMVDGTRPYDPHARPAPQVPDLRMFAQLPSTASR